MQKHLATICVSVFVAALSIFTECELNQAYAADNASSGNQFTIDHKQFLEMIRQKCVGCPVAPTDRWRSQVGISISNGEYGFCSGTLVHPKQVLTAWHCLSPPPSASGPTGVGTLLVRTNDLTIRVGLADLSNMSQLTDRSVVDRIDVDSIHELISGSELPDMVLLKLKREPASPVKFEVMRLQTPNDLGHSAVSIPVEFAGWGRTASNQPSTITELRLAKLEIVPESACNGIAPSIQLCAKDPKGVQTACNGDSGAALISEVNNTRLQIGVLSGGNKTCLPGDGIEFSKVAPFLQ